jgi:thermitase
MSWSRIGRRHNPDGEAQAGGARADATGVRLALSLVLSALVVLILPVSALAAGTRIIVKRDPGLSAGERADLRADAEVRFAETLPLANTEIVVAKAGDASGALRELNADPDVQYAELDRTVRAFSNDTYFGDQWALQNLGEDIFGTDGFWYSSTADADMDVVDPDLSGADAWSLSLGAGHTVAVVDSGVDATHEDLAGNVASGLDWVGEDAVAADASGHGTHVAGTIAAIRDNGVGVAGVAPKSRVLPLRVLDEDGEGPTSDVVAAFALAGRLGVRVVNASFGSSTYSQAERDAIAANPETLFVAAAGNTGAAQAEFPCAYPLANVICVGASDQNDQVADFSNFSSVDVDVFAPGVNIGSTLPGNDYGWGDGTSMAAPEVAGVAALLLERDPALTASELKQAIAGHVDVKPAFDGKAVSGGRVNAASALQSVPADRDGDGVEDATDPCPDRAGATDCSAPQDRDTDGIGDAADRCPDEAGAAPTGCIAVREDRDGDTKPDRFDACPSVPGLASTGCPPDSDGDGVPNSRDACPNVAARTANGCAVVVKPTPPPPSPRTVIPDRDGDGRFDSLDACPAERASTADGCPLPRLRSLKVSKRKHRKIRVRVASDRVATVTFKLERRVCNKKGKRCRWRSAGGDAVVTRRGVASFSSRTLRKGRYRVAVRLSSGAGRAKLQRKSFRI